MRRCLSEVWFTSFLLMFWVALVAQQEQGITLKGNKVKNGIVLVTAQEDKTLLDLRCKGILVIARFGARKLPDGPASGELVAFPVRAKLAGGSQGEREVFSVEPRPLGKDYGTRHFVTTGFSISASNSDKHRLICSTSDGNKYCFASHNLTCSHSVGL